MLTELALEEAMEAMKTRVEQRLRCLIDQLGTTPTEVRNFLAARRVKGTPTESDSCVLANFFNKRLPKGCEAEVGEFEIGIKHLDFEDLEVTIPTPKHLVKFIDAFDNGSYEELTRKDYWTT